MASNESTTQQPNQLAQPQRCRSCAWCEEHKGFSFKANYYGSKSYTSEEACYALHEVINSAISSPTGIIDENFWDDALSKGLPEYALLSSAVSWRRGHEENMQKQRQQLFLQQISRDRPREAPSSLHFPSVC